MLSLPVTHVSEVSPGAQQCQHSHVVDGGIGNGIHVPKYLEHPLPHCGTDCSCPPSLGGREGGRKGGKEGGREGGRKGGREGGREGRCHLSQYLSIECNEAAAIVIYPLSITANQIGV